MNKRHTLRRTTVAIAAALIALIVSMSGTAGAKSTGSMSGSVAYSANNSGTYGGCYYATSQSAVDARLLPDGAAVKGTLTINFAGTGFSLCAGSNAFQFTGNGGSLTGPVTGMAVNCNGGDPGPANVCTLTLWLTAANGSARFGVVTGQLQVQIGFRVVSGDFYAGTFGTAGTGTITGSLAL